MSSVIKIDTTVEKNGLTLEKVCQLFCSKKVFQIQNSAFTWCQINFWISNLILLPLTKSFFSYCRIFSFKLPKNIKARAYRKRNNKKGNIVFCNLFTHGALRSSFKKKNSFERSLSIFPFSLPSFPFSPETPDTQASSNVSVRPR